MKPRYRFLLVGILPIALLFASCSKQEDSAKQDAIDLENDAKNAPGEMDKDLKTAWANIKKSAIDMKDHAVKADHSAVEEFRNLVRDFQARIDRIDEDAKGDEVSVNTDFDDGWDEDKDSFDKLDSHVKQYNKDLTKDARKTWDDITKEVEKINRALR